MTPVTSASVKSGPREPQIEKGREQMFRSSPRAVCGANSISTLIAATLAIDIQSDPEAQDCARAVFAST